MRKKNILASVLLIIYIFGFIVISVVSGDDGTVGTLPVPEPATLLLLGVGLVGLAGFGRKRFKK
jgi:purine-cytosine permease-like protein